MNQAYLIVGSNIDPELNIPLAFQHLLEQPELRLLHTSSVWKTRPIGSMSEKHFLNVAVHLITSLNEYDLKENVLCEIEKRMGRVRVEDKFAPRTIDLDIVLFNDHLLDENLFRYDYLVLPFSELIPEYIAPLHGITMKDLASSIKPFSTASIVNLPLPSLPAPNK